uniref:Uncharacterized protein n=1 Tax=Loigolactobacillus rennini TaxID=238013 RepID=A0A1K2I4U5_9LACO|nr:hypothetical protein LREN565_0374 [Loigolactobacillus rennini]
MPKISDASDVDHSTMAKTAKLKHGSRKKLLSVARLLQRH